MGSNAPHHAIVIIGAGFSGLGAAIRLAEDGFKDIVILERAGDVGGVWRDNTYPGCACDVESHLYSFSFAPDPSWSRMFAPQPEIWSYLQRVTSRYALRDRIRFNTSLASAAWDEARRHWHLETSQGPMTADILIAAMGALSEPLVPRLPGLERFQGEVFHSARWNHGYDLAGKRVAVVGTGASAIQFIPEIQPLVAKLVVFQRTPPWVLPRFDRALTARERATFARVPAAQRLWRLRVFALRELLGLTFRNRRFIGWGKKFALKHLARAVRDPDLRAKLTPSYTIGCKRILLSNNYYPALTQPNVAVETAEIAMVGAHSITTTDGVSHEVDAIIFGTGFRVTEMPFSQAVAGRGGRTLADAWAGTPRAHLGTTVAGFPNLFILLGPNTGLGHNSVVLMIEAQIEHVRKALAHLRRKKMTTIEPTQVAQERFNKELDAATTGTVWTSGGCSSWYLDRNGHNSTLWPGSVGAFERRVGPFKSSDYNIGKGA